MFCLYNIKNKGLSFLNFLIILLIINNTYNYIVFPFKSTNYKFNSNNNHSINDVDHILSEINKNKLYSIISFGNPPKNLEFYFTMEKMFYAVMSNFCPKDSNSSYNPYLSITYKNLSSFYKFGPIENAYLSTESCSFYNNSNLKESKIIKSFSFIFGNNTSPKNKNIDKNKFCGTMGLSKNLHGFIYDENIINYFKKTDIIDSYSWSIIFFDKDNSYNIDDDIKNKYDGFYIVGITNNDYLNIFKTENIISSYASKTNDFSNYFQYNIDLIFFYEQSNNNRNIISNNTLIEFDLDYNYIISKLEYYIKIKKFFFQKYLDNNICIEKNNSMSYDSKIYMIICDTAFKKYINYFPSIYFYSREFSFNFILDYKDVFFEMNNKIYFLIVGKGINKADWKLGKIFMKKYPFIFDQDKKTISFIHLDKFRRQVNEQIKENEKKNSFSWIKLKEYFLYSLLFIGILIGLFIGRRIWNKHRKLRANELEEKFEYVSHDKITKIID